jgi:hypothetical protein
MTEYLKQFLKNSIRRLIGVPELRSRLEEIQKHLDDPTNWGRVLREVVSANQGMQQILSRSYRASRHPQLPLVNLNDIEFRCFSQNGEDGILLYLFSVVGTTNKKVVEICAGNGIECNAANLIINHGWSGLLFDGDERNIAEGRQFYGKCRDTFWRPPTLVYSWITAENVNELISHPDYTGGIQPDFTGDIDLLSLDLDGMDYWIWKALTCVRPRVIILEFNSRWGPERAVTLPYQADFRIDMHRHPWCSGASLSAFVKLGRERGYRLVGTNRLLSNALFLRADVGGDFIPEISAAEAYARNPIGRRWSPDWLPDRAQRPEWWDAVEV